MKAHVLYGINDLRLKTVPDPLPDENEVIVEVKAVGICGSDIPRIYKTGAHIHPLIPGHEFSGMVIKLGRNVDPKWKGKRVGVFPLISCGKCAQCQKKQYEMCRDYNYLGSRKNGAFAEFVAVPADNLIALPKNVSFEEAAMFEPMAVSVHAMRRIQPKQHETIAVCGLGTIGLLILMFLKEAGMEHILVIGNKDFQKDIVLQMGISEKSFCDRKEKNVDQWLMEQTNGQGPDIFFECVGKNETYIQAVNNTAPAGRIMLMGNPYSDMMLEKSVYWKILRNQLTVMGTWNSSFTHDIQDDWHYVLKLLEQKRITPAELVSHRFLHNELEQGFAIMRDKTEDYIKIMGIM
ncbi:galactitol-1-phosphate 5-dehydrogenase [Lacrimispora sp.]|uniref:galactitol-1-phosphate 5-dehydrogenase n=1 Tax=Lacrimispora sp. TaxID=2719234 RepID=UPI002897F8FC|nr:galactitol-1-phosphate 5-dehydrogenase [Lacrimispora sp.]